MPMSATARRSPLRCIGAPGRSTRSAAGADRLAPASPTRSRAVSSGSPGRSRSTDIGAVLDAAVDAGASAFSSPRTRPIADTMALWGAHAHLLHREELGVGFTPRLAFQSPTKRCGKSTALKCTYLMAHNPRMASSISPSSLFRAVDAFARLDLCR